MNCIYCGKECFSKNSLSNHQRLCKNNPTRVYKSNTLGKPAWNKGLKKENNESLLKLSETKKKNYINGSNRLTGFCSPEYIKSDIFKNMCKNNGGYRHMSGTSKKFKVTDSFNNDVTLQSTYELLCSQILNSLEIKWIRPSYLKYGSKKYFPDFYLVDYNIYLDPKNDYLAKKDINKINEVILENNVVIHILTKDKINEEFIKTLVA